MSEIQFSEQPVLCLRADPTKVIIRPFKLATEPRDLNPTDKTRVDHIIERVLALDLEVAAEQLADVLENFQGRHRNFLKLLAARAAEIDRTFADNADLNKIQRELIGAYFLHEFSFEAAALFNPSIVLHPDQSSAPEGGCRFILSLRAVGEGHISSLTFRSGSIAADGTITMDTGSRLATLPQIQTRISEGEGEIVEIAFDGDEDISERVIFPITTSQSRGIEDARFVECDEDGQKIYRATYTAYNGWTIRSELIETTDFVSFKMSPLKGDASKNKGMALFPRKIHGQYAMITRQDNENLYLTYSNNLYSWGNGQILLTPQYPWEFVQIGNCGSPIELDEGWLLLTHGVGPVRRYTIGAVLLDKHDPSKVLARSAEPLIYAKETEREGYVPNVVYTCGALRHNNQIILPYGVSDTFTNITTIKIADLLRMLEPVEATQVSCSQKNGDSGGELLLSK